MAPVEPKTICIGEATMNRLRLREIVVVNGVALVAADDLDLAVSARLAGKIEGLRELAARFRAAGATLPAPEIKGTPESGVTTGMCLALAVVESEIEKLEQP